MDNTLIVAIIMGVAVGIAFAVVTVGWGIALTQEAGRSHREAMKTLSDLFKQHTISLENLKAIESGPDGMRGVVARTRPAPSLLEDPPEPESKPPDLSQMAGFVDVGHSCPSPETETEGVFGGR